jgi:hypothetical protein
MKFIIDDPEIRKKIIEDIYKIIGYKSKKNIYYILIHNFY